MPHANGDLGMRAIGWSFELIKPPPYYLSRCDKCGREFQSATRKDMNMVMRYHDQQCSGPVIPRPEPIPTQNIDNEPPF